MKKIFLLLMMLASLVAYAQQEQPEIKFDKTVHNFGTFSEKTPVQTAVLHSLISAKPLSSSTRP